MGLFKRKSKYSASEKVLARIKGKPIRYVSERDENSVETIIGKHGFIDYDKETFTVRCDGAIVFSCPVNTVEVYELISLGGARISGVYNGIPRTVTVFFTLFNK